MKANKVAILVVTALLVQTQVAEATFFTHFFDKWHSYYSRQGKEQEQKAPATRQEVAVPPTRVQTGTAETFSSVAAAASATPQLSTLLAAASAVELDDGTYATFLADQSLVVTVFAPTDAAFEEFLDTYGLTTDELLAESDLLSIILSYHVVSDTAATAASLSDGNELPTQNGDQTIKVIKRGGNVILDPSGEDAPNARVVGADIKAGESIVHIIDQVLVPDNFPLTKGGAAAAADATATGVDTTTITTTDTLIGDGDIVEDDFGDQVVEEGARETLLDARQAAREGTSLERNGIDNGIAG